MAKRNSLTTRQAIALIRAGRPGATSDGAGLYLRVTAPGRAKWTLRYSRNRQAREMGLGATTAEADRLGGVTLAQAREGAAEARAMLAKGLDPIEARRATPGVAATFRCALDGVLRDRVSAGRSEKHKKQWRTSMEIYAAPLLDIPVDKVTTEDVLHVLRPIWRVRPQTASRVRQRIEVVLAAARVRGLRTGENPAAWRGHLADLLPAPRRVAPVRHRPAIDWREAPAFVAELRRRPAVTARCLEFAILSAARMGEARGATWGEIDLEARLWQLPGSRMKSGRPHRVPLSEPAVALLRALRPAGCSPDDHVFPGERSGRPLSEMATRQLLRRLNRPEGNAHDPTPRWRDGEGRPISAHGFRSTFRDWAAECAGFPDRLAEAALAHVTGGTEAAYQRGDRLERRRELMEAWARFLVSDTAGVVPTTARRAAE